MLYFTQAPYSTLRLILLTLLIASQWSNSHGLETGEQLFLNNCAECHQGDGAGLKNIYPALTGNELVQGSGVDVALVLIIGRGEMPSFDGSLSFEEMARVINHIRNSWENSGEEISAEMIESLRP